MITEVIKSWSHLNEVFENIPTHKDCLYPRWIFRGQSDKTWNLIPKILRYINKYDFSKDEGLGTKKMLTTNFHTKYHNYTDKQIPTFEKMYPLAIWSLMQHYSCPTRLLDWTESPFIAFFYAVESNLDKDGAIYLFNSTLLENVNDSTGQSFKSIPETLIYDYPKIDLIFPFYPTFQNMRLILQKGLFTFSTNIKREHGELIDDTFERNKTLHSFYKLIIPSNLKTEFLSRLLTMNITASILFPDLDGLGKSLGNLIDIRFYTDKQ